MLGMGWGLDSNTAVVWLIQDRRTGVGGLGSDVGNLRAGDTKGVAIRNSGVTKRMYTPSDRTWHTMVWTAGHFGAVVKLPAEHAATGLRTLHVHQRGGAEAAAAEDLR